MSVAARIRFQVWTDAGSARIFAALVAELEDEWASVILIGDAEVRRQRMRAADYLALPYRYFEDIGPAPRPTLFRRPDRSPC
jgi:hypothetical protein